MIASFVVGFLAGIACLAFVASRFADKPKLKAKPNGIAATSVSVNGNGLHPATLAEATQIFRQLDQGRA
jgi:hypothetical protein